MFLQSRAVAAWSWWSGLVAGLFGVIILLLAICYCRLMPRHHKPFDEQYLNESYRIKESHIQPLHHHYVYSEPGTSKHTRVKHSEEKKCNCGSKSSSCFGKGRNCISKGSSSGSKGSSSGSNSGRCSSHDNRCGSNDGRCGSSDSRRDSKDGTYGSIDGKYGSTSGRSGSRRDSNDGTLGSNDGRCGSDNSKCHNNDSKHGSGRSGRFGSHDGKCGSEDSKYHNNDGKYGSNSGRCGSEDGRCGKYGSTSGRSGSSSRSCVSSCDSSSQTSRSSRPVSYAGDRQARSHSAHHKPTPAQYASSGVLDDLEHKCDDVMMDSESLKTRSLPSFMRPRPRPLSSEADLYQLYDMVSSSKRHRSRMRNEHAALIALSKTDSIPLDDAEVVIVYDQRTEL